MKDFFRFGIQVGLFAGAIIVASSIAMGIAAMGKSPTGDEEQINKGPLVRGMKVQPTSFEAPIVAYGTVEAPKVYSLRSQVSGEVLKVNPNFIEGRPVKIGDIIVEIDPRDIEMAIIEAEAQIARIQADIDQTETRYAPLDIEIQRIRQSSSSELNQLDLARRQLADAQQRLEKEQRLVERGVGTQTAVNREQETVNQRQREVQRLQDQFGQFEIQIQAQETQKSSIRAQRKVLEAQKKVAEAQLERQKLTLGRTTIKSPAAGIVFLREPSTGVKVKQLSLGDIVQPGMDLGWVMPMDVMDIPVSIDVEDSFWIQGVDASDREIDFAHLDEFLSNVESVEVAWYAKPEFKWVGMLHRLKGELDVSTRTATFIIRVNEPGTAFAPGRKIPLTPGMYCRVKIPSSVQEGVLAIDRSALREDNRVFTAKNDVLVVKRFIPHRMTENRAVMDPKMLTDEERNADSTPILQAGDILILSDLPQAVPGMKVRTQLPGQ